MPIALYTVRAAIESPTGDADARVGSWEISDDWGYAARGFTLQGASAGQIQVGNHVAITAGYDANRVTLMRGRVQSTDQPVTSNEIRRSAVGQDLGVAEILGTPITYVWEARPPSVFPRAHTIIREAAAQIGVGVGTLGFPDYPLYASYTAHRRKLLEIVQDLMEPWNQFAQIQHVPIIRDKSLSVLRVDWANPPSNGYVVPRSRLASQQRSQQSYDDEPRLTTVTDLVVRGAAYTQDRPNLGTERRYHYASRQVDRQIIESFAGTYGDFVWLEIYTLEERDEGKVTRTVESHYQTTLDAAGVPGASTLVRRVTVDYSYYVPTQAIQQLVAFEPVTLRNAVCWGMLEVNEGVDDQTSVFGPVTRSFKQNFYDENGQQYAEEETVQEYDTTAGQWKPARVTTRTHAQTTSSTVRTQLTSYTVDPDDNNKLTFDVQDSQQVGGQLTTTNSQVGRDEAISVQVQFPSLDLVNGVPTERRRSSNAWVYENAYIGPAEAQQIYDLARQEQILQTTPVRWETISFEGTLDPNLWAGQPVQIEIDDGVFESYWTESVRHRFDTNGARTSGVGRRLTESVMVDPTIAAVVSTPSNPLPLTAARGLITLTGQAAALKHATVLPAAVGSFALTGEDATLTLAAFDPYTLPNQLWMLESDGITPQSDDTDLALWPDDSASPANSNDIVFPSPSDGGTSPKYRTSIFGTLPGVQVGAGDQGEMTGFSPSLTGQSATLYFVVDYQTTDIAASDSGLLFFTFDVFVAAGNDIGVYVARDSSPRKDGVAIAGGIANDIANSVSGPQVLVWKLDKAAGTITLYRGGTSVGSISGLGTAGWDFNGNLQWFAILGGALQQYVGYIGASFGFSALHSDAIRNGIEGYLSTKYGI